MRLFALGPAAVFMFVSFSCRKKPTKPGNLLFSFLSTFLGGECCILSHKFKAKHQCVAHVNGLAYRTSVWQNCNETQILPWIDNSEFSNLVFHPSKDNRLVLVWKKGPFHCEDVFILSENVWLETAWRAIYLLVAIPHCCLSAKSNVRHAKLENGCFMKHFFQLADSDQGLLMQIWKVLTTKLPTAAFHKSWDQWLSFHGPIGSMWLWLSLAIHDNSCCLFITVLAFCTDTTSLNITATCSLLDLSFGGETIGSADLMDESLVLFFGWKHFSTDGRIWMGRRPVCMWESQSFFRKFSQATKHQCRV